MTATPFGAVLFDCDGVLVDSEGAANRVWVALLAAHGLAFAPADFLLYSVGRTLSGLYAGLERDFGWTRPPTFDAELDAALQLVFRTMRPVPGAPELLAALRAAGLPFAVASNSRRDRLDLKLAASGLAPLLAGRVHDPSQVARGKPAPDLYLHAASGLGVAPARCLVVEDSVLGVSAGVAAGMTVWGFMGGDHSGEHAAPTLLAAGAARTFGRLADLGSALGVPL